MQNGWMRQRQRGLSVSDQCSRCARFERDLEQTIPDKKAILRLYCGGGSRLAAAAESLQKMGDAGVVSMASGWQSRREAAYPVADD